MEAQFSEIRSMLIAIATQRRDTWAKITKLNEDRKNYSESYAKQKVDPEIAFLQKSLRVAHQQAFEKAVEILASLKAEVIEKHAKLDLNNPAWATALKLIELGGQTLEPETISKINSSFAGNQPALRALLGIYQQRGIDARELGKMVYDPEFAFDSLNEAFINCFIRGGSVNALSTTVSKFASWEGIEFPAIVDEIGLDEQMRLASGLPVSNLGDQGFTQSRFPKAK